MKPTCAMCVFYDALRGFDAQIRGSTQGRCRKATPVMLDGYAGGWPVVNKDDWCGEFKLIVPEQAVQVLGKEQG